ncbi:TIGR03619 family F420-dependent LLM class oxidoreductase [Aromatoleum anaerobium]|uniref:TIGR03619 family F420-dependent LLM class oxidoreductase n=1 Tax=Aromatoleum anaerobium TaxID=182180 RepID=A0ABX1PMH0_9RHOO|nr:TIGR03619 family F420-dependent LLM class oxidoreductase [Aromatoleum anaerobium]MCK0508175.1 TIGR03619 family F420-dependent LLM class oxidoreductase [Aromatoleum anaerobium]
MRFVLQLGFSNFRNYPAIAQAAEAAGWTWLSMPDSLFFPQLTESDYPYAETSAIRQYLEHSAFIEPFVAMSTMAALTSRIKFYPGVLKVPVRQPLILAKLLTSLAVMSNGRVALGAGLSPWKEDFLYNGVDFDKRGELMDECIAILRGVMGEEFFEHHGKHYDFGPLRMRPVPEQPVPIFIGGHSKPALRRAARVGDGWVSANTDVPTLKGLIAELNGYRAEFGTRDRDFEIHGIDFSAHKIDDFHRLAEVGVTHAGVVPWDIKGDPANLTAQLDAIRRFGDEVIAKMS